MSQISVIVPVYNTGKYLCRCLDSIEAQTFPDFDVITVDDGTPDAGAAVCDEYALTDPRFFVIHRHNGGPALARNHGIDLSAAASHSKWLSFIDSDDWVESAFLAAMLGIAVSNDADVAQCPLSEAPEANAAAKCSPDEAPEAAAAAKCSPDEAPEANAAAKCSPDEAPEAAAAAKCSPNEAPEAAAAAKCSPNEAPEAASVAQCFPGGCPEPDIIKNSCLSKPVEHQVKYHVKQHVKQHVKLFTGREACLNALQCSPEPPLSVNTSACNKIFKKELFGSVRFPGGMLYEDTAILPCLLYGSSRVAVTDADLYHYRTGHNSITHRCFDGSQFMNIAACDSWSKTLPLDRDEELRTAAADFREAVRSKTVLKAVRAGVEIPRAYYITETEAFFNLHRLTSKNCFEWYLSKVCPPLAVWYARCCKIRDMVRDKIDGSPRNEDSGLKGGGSPRNEGSGLKGGGSPRNEGGGSKGGGSP